MLRARMPPLDTRGRNVTFDPALYRPRLQVNGPGNPVGPPIGGFVQPGNVISEYDLPDVPNVGTRILRSVDPNNFAPRVGFAFSPLDANRLVVRGGYGIFYSRISFTHLSTAIQLPPNYIVGRRTNPPFADPFFAAPPVSSFPTFVPGVDLATLAFDRNMPRIASTALSIRCSALSTDAGVSPLFMAPHSVSGVRVGEARSSLRSSCSARFQNSFSLPAGMPARSQSWYASASISSLLGSGIGFLRVEGRPHPRGVWRDSGGTVPGQQSLADGFKSG